MKNKRTQVALGLTMAMLFTMTLSGCSEASAGTPYDYELAEYVTVGKYKGLEIEKKEVSVTQEDLDKKIEAELELNKTPIELKEGIVEDGDTANIDYVGKVGGKVFDGGSAKASDLIIGSGQFIDGFESGLIGIAVGDTTVLKLKFPEPYQNQDMAGKDVDFEVKVNSIKREVLPKYDIDFVKKQGDYATTEDYETHLKKVILEEKENTAKTDMQNALWTQVAEGSKVIKYPTKELSEYKTVEMDYIKEEAKGRGISIEELVKTVLGMTMEEYEKASEDMYKVRVEQELIMYSIARAEKLEVTEKEYQTRISEILKEQGFKDEKDFKSQAGMSFEEYAGGRASVESNFLMEKVMKLIEDNMIVK